MKTQVEQVNENALLIRFGDSIDKSLPAVIASANRLLHEHFADWLIDTIPAYTTLLVVFDDNMIEMDEVVRKTRHCLDIWQHDHQQQYHQQQTGSPTEDPGGREILIPVYYDPEVAPDLEHLAREKNLSIDDIKHIHSGVVYTVYAIGFAPGFAFLGNVDERIAAPRLATPRQHVARGSIGIAGLQTGIYPRSSPGGWNIIGRTPREMFFPDETPDNLCPLRIGDQVRFTPISRNEFIDLGGSVGS